VVGTVRLRGLALFAESQLSVRFHREVGGHGGSMRRQGAVALIRTYSRPGACEYRYCVRPVEEDVERNA
jgi:hypothetical protein